MSGSKIKMVIDIATDRIIWFGPVDFPLEETHIEGAAIAFFEGQTPPGMRASNSWNYRLINQKIVPPVVPQINAPVSPLDASKQIVVKAIRAAVDKFQNENGVPQRVADFLITEQEALHRATKVTRLSEAIASRYIGQLQAATASEDLVKLRDAFTKELNETEI